MAVKTLYFKNAVPTGGTSARSLQDGGSAPAAGVTTTGWTVAKVAAVNFSTMAGGSERASGTFSSTTTQLDSFSEATAWRSEDVFNGTFAGGNWPMAFKVRAVTSASSQAGRVRARLWKSANADGSIATQLTSALLTGTTTAALSTSASQTSTVTWTPTATYYTIATGLTTAAAWGVDDATMGFYQTFTTPSDASTVTSCTVGLARNGSPADNLTVDLFAVDGSNKPTGSSLGSCTPVTGASISTSNTRVAFSFTAPVAVSPNTKYALVIKRTAASPDAINNYDRTRGVTANFDPNQGSGFWTKSTDTFATISTQDIDIVVTGTIPTTFTNEYLFVTCEWNITTVSGNANADVLFYIESTAAITTPDFSVASATGTGTPAGQAGSASGAGISSSEGTGTPTGDAAAVSGEGTVASAGATGTGAVAADAAVVSGSGVSASSGTGALAAQSATVAGVGTSASSGTGALSAQAATVAATGTSASDGTGALVAQAATVAASGTVASAGTGVLVAQAAAVVGTGAAASAGTGTVVAGSAEVAGTGTAAAGNTGALVAQSAAVAGLGVSSSAGTGALQAGAVTVAGAGLVASTGTGALVAGSAVVVGEGVVLAAGAAFGTGALVAGAATITGTGEVTGEVAPDIPLGAFMFGRVAVEGYAVAVLPELEAFGRGVVGEQGFASASLPALEAQARGEVIIGGRAAAAIAIRADGLADTGPAGIGKAAIDLRAAARGSRVTHGRGHVEIKLGASADGYHDPDEAVVIAFLMAA